MSLLFSGDFASPDQPLWLSYLTPTPGPNNPQVSTLSVNASGGIVMDATGPNPESINGAQVAFNRVSPFSPTTLEQVPSKQVPTKTLESTYLASATNGGLVYDDIALSGLQIYGPQVTAPSANSGCAGYLTKGALPFSVELYTGQFFTPNVYATNGYFSTLTVSTGTDVIPDPLSINTLIAKTANISTISTGTITAAVGNFSSINSPGGTTTTSTVNTNLVSTTVAIAKEIFTSTMTFNASLSPNVDLGLGGIIGGVVGAFGANALSVGLGAAALGTGIAGLVMPRTSGGTRPGTFQTINGTSQLQFSTLGATTQTIFVNTTSTNPSNTPGFPTDNISYIPAGTYCMRTVSDPINLANASGSNGQGIQGFSEWTPVYPGYAQLQSNTLTSVLTGNTISLGTSLGDSMSITPAPGRSLALNGTVVASNFITTGTFTTSNINASSASISSLTASTFTIGNTVFTNLTATTLNANTVNSTNENVSGTFTAINRVRLSSGGSAGQGVTIGNTTGSPLDGNSLVVTGNTFTNSLSVGIGNIFASEINNLVAINGQPYPPVSPGSGIPPGSVIAFAGPVIPSGWLLCDGSAYSSTNPTYSALYTAISTAYGGIPGGTFNVPDMRTRTIFGASTPGFQGDTTPWPLPIIAMTFSALQGLYSGTVVPNGTSGNGRGALAVTAIPLGFELAVGMRVQATSGIDIAIHVIVAILNYPGGGGSYTNPNFPVLIINPPFTADSTTNTQFTVTPVGPYNYRVSQSTIANYYTQLPTDVPAHTHGNKKGGINAPIDTLENNASGNPTNNSDQITQGVTTNFYYSVGSSTLGQPATVFNIGTSMYTPPSMVCMNYIIKL